MRELQAAFLRAMFGPDGPELLETIVGDGLLPAARLQIYRHHVLTSLTDVLQATFPVICRLVDERFFRYAADAYIRQHPPAVPCLFEYGAHFPAFLAAFPPCRHLEYLADVARLEWAMHTALHAEVRAPLDPAELGWPGAALRWLQLTFQFDPSGHAAGLPWPIDQIWRVHQADEEVYATAGSQRRGVALEIRRWEDHVGFRQLDPVIYTFRTTLVAGHALASWLPEAALAASQEFDCVAALHELLTDGAVIGFRSAAVVQHDTAERAAGLCSSLCASGSTSKSL